MGRNIYIIKFAKYANIITCYVGSSIYKNLKRKRQKEESMPQQMLNKNIPYVCNPPYHGSEPP
jgi:hypothetical protein